MERWNGSVAVVTGASSGIGLATAQQLVLHGLIVIGLARRIDKMKEGMKDVKGPGQFHPRECDITNEASVIDAFNWIKNEYKGPQILINNAGTLNVNTVEDASTKDIENVFKLNVFGLLYCTKQAIPLMKQSQTDAHIINVNSLLGHKVIAIPNFPMNVYPATKYAVTALSETLMNELSDSKIRVTSISPGAVKTEIFDRFVAQNIIPSGMPALKAEDVSNSILHALSAPPHVEIDEIILTARHA